MTPMTPEEFGGAPGPGQPPHCVAALLALVDGPPVCGGLIFDAAWSTPQAASAEALRSSTGDQRLCAAAFSPGQLALVKAATSPLPSSLCRGSLS